LFKIIGKLKLLAVYRTAGYFCGRGRGGNGGRHEAQLVQRGNGEGKGGSESVDGVYLTHLAKVHMTIVHVVATLAATAVGTRSRVHLL
jgi:hypothetical protein